MSFTTTYCRFARSALRCRVVNPTRWRRTLPRTWRWSTEAEVWETTECCGRRSESKWEWAEESGGSRIPLVEHPVPEREGPTCTFRKVDELLETLKRITMSDWIGRSSGSGNNSSGTNSSSSRDREREREAMDPIAELLSQLSGVRRGLSGVSGSSGLGSVLGLGALGSLGGALGSLGGNVQSHYPSVRITLKCYLSCLQPIWAVRLLVLIPVYQRLPAEELEG